MCYNKKRSVNGCSMESERNLEVHRDWAEVA